MTENKSLPLKFQLAGGGIIFGYSNAELVQHMRQITYDQSRNVDEFMFETARRCKVQNSAEIDCYDVNTFIASLIQFGFLNPVK